MSRVLVIALGVVLGVASLVASRRLSEPSTSVRQRIPSSAVEVPEESLEESEPDVAANDAPLVELPARAPASTAVVAELPDEPSLMAVLRAATDPEIRIRLAREGERRFPNGPDAPERKSILIHALADLGRASEARGEAEAMVNGSPDSEWVREIERFTGAKRHRNLRLNEAGELEYYE